MYAARWEPGALVLRANLRRQAGPLVSLTVAALIAGFAVSQSTHRWIEIGENLHEAACGYGGAAAVLLASWQGGAEVRSGAEWIHATAVRGALPQRLACLASGVLWPLTGYLLAVLAVLVWPYARQPSHRPPFDAMTVDAASIVAVSCLAYLAGRTVPLPVTPFVLVTALILFGQSSWWLAITHPVEINYTGDALPPSASGWAPVHPHPWLPWCRVLIFAVVAAAAVSFCARCWKTAVVLVAVAGTAALGLHLTQKGSAAISAVNASEMRCSGRAAALCLPKENEGARLRLQPQVDRLAGKLRGVRSAPSYYVVSDQSYRYRDWGADDPADTGPRVIGIELSADARSLTRDIACPDLYMGLLEGAVFAWLTDTPPDSVLYREEQLHLVQVLDSLPPKQRANWLDRYLEAVWSGESPPDMPDTPRWSS
ncbi:MULTISPECIES: hypothetical protein [unclassified Streptomyces]|uniref:hypothetical protein n=1 Tax=unclassified Streptomyces TaxID=2593676 RepID=UPI001900516A|nr:hypothetical protein [Streptomyces sp. 303MFCol5.2]